MGNYCPIIDYYEDTLSEDQFFSNPSINRSCDCLSEVGFSRGQAKSLEAMSTMHSIDTCGIVGQGITHDSPTLVRDHLQSLLGDELSLHGIVVGFIESPLHAIQRENSTFSKGDDVCVGEHVGNAALGSNGGRVKNVVA